MGSNLKALVTGAAGQDGIILAAKLQKMNIEVTGLCSPNKLEKVKKTLPGINFIGFETSEMHKLTEIFNREQPDHVYNFVGFSSVFASWNNPSKAIALNSVIPALILEWCRAQKKSIRFLQASSSEIFGGSTTAPQCETTSLSPITPYGLSKAYAHELTGLYRDTFGLQANTAILYNHESPLRSLDFITRKISNSVAKISLGLETKLVLGDIQSRRDWGWAPDYVDGMIQIMQKETPGDYLIATGHQSTVENLLEMAFRCVGIDNYESYVELSMENNRISDPKNLVGNSDKMNKVFGWKPEHNIEFVIRSMVINDLGLLKGTLSEQDLSWIQE